MKRLLLFVILFASFSAFEAMGQCERIGLVGEFSGWGTDPDHFMTRSPVDPDAYSTIITLTSAQSGGDDIVELKFRQNSDWAVNWGGDTFPSGIGVPGGNNLLVPIGTYHVTFNCGTLAYDFQSTCGQIGLVGEFSGWGTSPDHFMTRDATNPDYWTTIISVSDAVDNINEMKFRQNSDWAVNWGGTYPSGIGVPGGDNFLVPDGTYKVTFNCATAEYNFVSTCGEIGLVGEFNGWGSSGPDYFMTRSATDPNEWSVAFSVLNATCDPNADGIIELKFRQNSDWTVNWGGDTWPSGIGVPGGNNLLAPVTAAPDLTTDYFVTFNCSTGAYNFITTTGPISIIGEFVGWNGDIPMNRDAADPNLWKLTRSWYADSQVKFRENNDWGSNWGDDTWPSGIGEPGGLNIPLVAGTYDVTFHSTTKAYNFVSNTTACGEIGLIGDFNTWGDDGSGVPTDVWMIRDPMYPAQFSILYNFTSSTDLWFRLDADPLYGDVWGGTFPEDTGEQGGPYIEVPGGKYFITFNCLSHDFKFTRLGNAVTAPQVFAINVNGVLDETDWDISQNVSQVVEGVAGEDLNEVFFGVAYNNEYLFVGLNVTDGILMPGEEGEVFVDGNKSGGAYDEFDVHLKFGATGLEIIHGPEGMIPLLGFVPGASGYTAELGIPWSALDMVPEEGSQIGFDIMIGDDDDGTGGPDYRVAWNGGLQNYEGTSSFGDLLFGTLSCGCISLYNSTIGDVVLQNPTDQPTLYVGTYEIFEDQSVVFRKDMDGTVYWGDDSFPTGVADVLGAEIPSLTGRYRVNFNCVTGEFSFVAESAEEGVAYSEYTDTPPVIDGDLSEFNLQYDCIVPGAGIPPNTNNNTVTWGSLWDGNNLYLAANVVDAVVEGAGNPWDNDAIEFYIDGNHDSDGPFDGDFDTQLILDALNLSTLWIKADGVQITDYESVWAATGTGYAVELRLGWADFSFLPGKGRSIGFSLGNNDSDQGLGRDYQTVWYGTGNNWSNTDDLGDLQLNGGPYFFGVDEIEDLSAFVVVYPNPTSSYVYLQLANDTFSGKVTVMFSDIAGKTISAKGVVLNSNVIRMDASQFAPGIYFINILGENGERAVKKLIVR